MHAARIDLSDGLVAVPVWRRGADRAFGIPTGVVLLHDECRTFVPWAGPEPVVELLSLEPLLWAPAVVCTCGEHTMGEAG